MSLAPSVFTLLSRLALLVGALVVTGIGVLGARGDVTFREPGSEASRMRDCVLENEAYSAGERIVYKLYYNLNFIWLSAGEVVFTVEDEGTEYKLTAEGKTYSTYEWFFKVHDRYTSFISKETLLPRLSTREIQEGKYTLYERVEYDQEAGTGLGYRGKSKAQALERPVAFEVGTCMHDVLSAIYYMRNLDMSRAAANEQFPVTVVMDRKTYPLDVRFIGLTSEKKIRGLGKFDVYELAPEMVVGDVFSDESDMRVWASKAKSHVPLMIESPISVGSVKAVLKEHRNLRHAIVAK